MTAGNNELSISRLINATPGKVWKAWSRPEHLARWWIPHPMECKVIKLDLRPGGGFETRMREGTGTSSPMSKGAFSRLFLNSVWCGQRPWLRAGGRQSLGWR
jgi:uncharacterized protein YndB with AHSA1/START domain